MKRIFISLLFIVLVSVIAAVEFGYICAKTDNFDDLINQSDELIFRNEYDSASKLCEKIENEWYESASYIDIYLHHDYVDDIGQCITRMRSYASNNNADMYFAESSQAKKKLASIRESEYLSLENIL